jgi:hypothetical protein
MTTTQGAPVMNIPTALVVALTKSVSDAAITSAFRVRYSIWAGDTRTAMGSGSAREFSHISLSQRYAFV